MTRFKLILPLIILYLSVLIIPSGNLHAAKQRNFMMVFEVNEYSVKIKETIQYFFENIFQKETDQFILVTPKRILTLSRDKLSIPKDQLIKNIFEIVQKDISEVMIPYRTLKEEMIDYVQNTDQYLASTALLTSHINQYKARQEALLASNKTFGDRLLKYAEILRKYKGDIENQLILILKRESHPIPNKYLMQTIRSRSSDGGMGAMQAFSEYPKAKINKKKLTAALKYAKVRFHLLYLQEKEYKARRSIEYVENSRDKFKICSKFAKATDGISMKSINPDAFLKQIKPLVSTKVEVEVVDEKMEEKK